MYLPADVKIIPKEMICYLVENEYFFVFGIKKAPGSNEL